MGLFTTKTLLTSVCLLIAAATGRAALAEDKPVAGNMPDAQMKAVLDELAALNGKPIETLSAQEARKQPSPTDAVMALLKKQGKSTEPEAVGKVENKTIPGPKEDIPVRVYTPKGAGPFPVLVYFHGGGFVIATIDTYDASCRALCNGANCVVMSVEYRKAPENKYPAAVDDAWAAYEWATKNAASVGGDAKHIAVGGESAGGNLAAVTSLIAMEKHAAMPVFQLLVYPVVDGISNDESYKENENAKPLNKAMMAWFFDKYLPLPSLGLNSHVAPIKAEDVANLPPAMVITAQIDPLRSEGKAYADKLKERGVSVEYKNYDGVTHEFFGMGAVVDKAKQAEMDAAGALKAAFAK